MPGPEPGLREKVESHLSSIREGLIKKDHGPVFDGLMGLRELSRTETIPTDHPLMDQSVLETLSELLRYQIYGGDSVRILHNILQENILQNVEAEGPLVGEDHPFMRFVFPRLVSPVEIDKPSKAFMLSLLVNWLPESIGPDHPLLGPDFLKALTSYAASREYLSKDTNHNVDEIFKKLSKAVPVEKITEFLASENPGDKLLGRRILEQLRLRRYSQNNEKMLKIMEVAAERPQAFDRETKEIFAEKMGKLLRNGSISAVQFEQNPALLEFHPVWGGLPPETKTMEEFASEVGSSLLKNDFNSALFPLLQAKKLFPDLGFYDVLKKLPQPEQEKLYEALDKHKFPEFDTEHFEIPISSFEEAGQGPSESTEIRDKLGESLRVSEFAPSEGLPDSFDGGVIMSEGVHEKFKENPKDLVGKPIGIAKKRGTWMVLYLKEITPDGKAKIVGLCSPGIDWLGEGTGYVRENGRESPISLSPPAAILYKLDKLAEMGAEKELVEDHIKGHVNTYLKIFDALSRLLRKEK